ncbi:MAG: hypothetical protein IPM91_17690 [Bacteroidetes bacterium]|nr:hypothetical protein [Bacteroidota bacterium]
MKIKISLAFLFSLLLFFEATAQQGVTTFGVCLRPSFPNSFLRPDQRISATQLLLTALYNSRGLALEDWCDMVSRSDYPWKRDHLYQKKL